MIYLMKVLKNIFGWLLPKTTTQNQHKTLDDQKQDYIDYQMENYVDENELLKWEGEQVPHIERLENGRDN